MINILGWYAFTMAFLTLLADAFGEPVDAVEIGAFKIRKCMVWIMHCLFVIATILAWRS